MRLKVGEEIYEMRDVCDIMDNNFKWTFTEMFVEPESKVRLIQKEDIQVNVNEIMKNMDLRKSVRPGDVAEWILRECENS